MARREYGGDTTAFTTTAAGLIRGGLDVWFWRQRTGGEQITDLLPVGSTGASVNGGVLHTGPDAFIDVLGPDDFDEPGVWVSASASAPRRYLRALLLGPSDGGGTTPPAPGGTYLAAYPANY